MEFSASNLVSTEQILSDVLRNVDDEKFEKFTPGYYKSLVQQAMEQLDLHSFFTKKIEYFNIPSNLQLPIPANCFNVREIYLFNGDCCDISTSQVVWWKNNYKVSGSGYTANVKATTDDYYYKKFTSADQIYFYNVFNSTIHLSSACAGYTRLMVVFNGLSVPIGTAPIIPIQMRRAVIDWVTLEIMKKMKVRNPKLYRPLYADAYNDLYNKQTGSWWSAMDFVTSMDSHMRQSLTEYLSKANE